MIRLLWLLLACSSIVIAENADDIMVPTCERKSPIDIHFDLAKTGMTELKKDFLNGDSVTCIDLADNTICNMQAGAFDRLPGLLYLNLARNPISFGNFMGMKLPALRGLVLDGPFKQYGLASEKHNPTSSYYNFAYESYDYYSEKEGHRSDDVPTILLPSLEKLSFRNYQKDAVREWLKHINAPKLTHLDIEGNQLDEIILPESFMASLTHLSMKRNKVHMVIQTLRKIRYLSLERNQIHHLCVHTCGWNSMSLAGMTTLERLSLAYNKIDKIERHAFDKAANLESINFEGNKISSFPRNLFKHTKLWNLTLTRNNLTKVPDVCGLVELQVLGLGRNKIRSIGEATFCNLANLRSIDLHGNKLKSIPSGTFAHLPALLELDLSRNRLTALAPNWVGSKERLTSLNLDGNLFNEAAKKNEEGQSLNAEGPKDEPVSLKPNGTLFDNAAKKTQEDKQAGLKSDGDLSDDAAYNEQKEQPPIEVVRDDTPASPKPDGDLSDDAPYNEQKEQPPIEVVRDDTPASLKPDGDLSDDAEYNEQKEQPPIEVVRDDTPASLKPDGDLSDDAAYNEQKEQPLIEVVRDDTPASLKPDGDLSDDAAYNEQKEQPPIEVGRDDTPASLKPNGDLSDDIVSTATIHRNEPAPLMM